MTELGGSDTPAYPFRCVGCGRCADACLSCAGIIVFAHQITEYCQQRQQVR